MAGFFGLSFSLCDIKLHFSKCYVIRWCNARESQAATLQMHEGRPVYGMFPLDLIKYVKCFPATCLLFFSIAQIPRIQRSMETQRKCSPLCFFCTGDAHVGRASLWRNNGSIILSHKSGRERILHRSPVIGGCFTLCFQNKTLEDIKGTTKEN